MMNETLISINERYNLILEKIDAIRANIHLITADELEAAMTEMDKYEKILKQIEDLYPEEVSGRPI
jgi:prefoldin subunit 5